MLGDRHAIIIFIRFVLVLVGECFWRGVVRRQVY